MVASKRSKFCVASTLQAIVICSTWDVLCVGCSQCKYFERDASVSDLRKAVKRNHPMIMDMPELERYKDAAAQHWRRLLPEASALPMAVSHDGGFYNSFKDTESPIGISMVYPFYLEGPVPWSDAKEIMQFQAQRGKGEHVEIPALPPKYAKLLQRPSNIWYVDGKANDDVWRAVKSKGLKEFLKRLMKVQKGEGQKAKYPDILSLWMSGGNTSTRVHFDASDNWLCQFVGNKTLTMFHPHDSAKLYPIQFNMEFGGKAYGSVLDENTGLLSKQALPYYDEKGAYGAVDSQNLDLRQFPLYKDVTPLTCTIAAGQCIWIPQAWWHRVTSGDSGINLSLNLWFDVSEHEQFQIRGFDLAAHYDRLEGEIKKTHGFLRHFAKALKEDL